jgi:preprotein translocase subunit SecE
VNEQDKQPRLLAMMALVALVVAVVILVFFGVGYLFGRAYL